jgi:hypothetical protein
VPEPATWMLLLSCLLVHPRRLVPRKVALHSQYCNRRF